MSCNAHHHHGSLKSANEMDSDYSGNHTKLPKILLNGNNICMVRPILIILGSRALLMSPAAYPGRRGTRGGMSGEGSR